ncbi:conserved Plasmodium protein, unknown function [Plasmodium gallinaceum]|uniref:tRNA(Phe) 7-[(3-amino-3-carboxypropyl)-4-demethylwyosine(37)-N(4)]-methyltransferase n=1 Tax=Plasmodium gallinaceum TaxID=5849 RepID=A0A1J1GY20_PLAGA|nr:conserved Plasmodium protein, unknown function [Plasmodium gallinaceum]CRG97198.1 conserved Plasmodium protein, unknown function [Plasmodium gallinaceum]
MEYFLKKKKNVLKVVNYENNLNKYIDIYKNSEKNIYNIYLNIYKEYKKKVEENTLFSGGDEKSESLRKIEKKIKLIIEEKEINSNKDDKSIKKSIDLLIYPCIYEINKNESYYTSSCCSGRIVIFSEVRENNTNSENNFFNPFLKKKLENYENIKDTLNKKREEEIFVKYMKTNTTKNKKEEKKNISDCENYGYLKNKIIDNYQSPFHCSKNKLHKKNVHIFYSSHSHQNLEFDVNYIRKILIKENFINDYILSKNCSNFIEDNKISTQNKIRRKCKTKNYYSNSYTDDDKVKKIIKNKKESNKIFIKFEPFIIHIKCIDLLSALKLLKIAQYSGLKQSGILNFGKNVTVAVRGSVRMEHFLGNSIEIKECNLVKLIYICNNKMTKNLMQLIHFYECYKRLNTQNNYNFNFHNEISYLKYQDHCKEDKTYVKCTGKDEEKYKLRNGNKEYKINLKKKRKKEINLNKYNITLSKDNYIENKNFNIDPNKLLQWKILTNTFDIHNFFVWGHDIFIYKNKIYLYGGFSKGVRNNKLKIYDIMSKELLIYDTELPSLVFHTFLNLDDKFSFIFGGRKNPKNCTNKLWVYNIKNNSWILSKNLHYSNDHNNIIFKNKKVENKKGIEQPYSDEENIFNFGTDVPCSRFRHSCIFVKRYLKKKNNIYIIYIYGGVNNKGEILNDIWEGKIIINEEKNEAFVKWTQKNFYNKNEAFYIKNHTMVYHKKKNFILIIGGYKFHKIEKEEENPSFIKNECDQYINFLDGIRNLNDKYMEYLYAFDIKNDKFFFIKCKGDEQFSYPLSRFSHSTCLLDQNFFFLIGGLDIHKTLNDIWIFQIKNHKWFYLGKIPYLNMYIRSKVVSENYFVYIIGGGCTIFTFGSFFDIPIYANCTQIINFYKNYKNSLEDLECKEIFTKNNINSSRKMVNMNESSKLCTEYNINEYNKNNENYINTKEVIVQKKKDCVFKEEVKNFAEKRNTSFINKSVNNFNDKKNIQENGVDNNEKLLNSYFFQKNEKPKKKKKKKSTIYYNMSSDHKSRKQLYIFVKNKIFLKDIKIFLENIGNFDHSQKIYFSNSHINGINIEGYFIPVKRKFDMYENYEGFKNILDKIEMCDNREIFYLEKIIESNKEKNNFKNKLRNLFNKFVNNNFKNYINKMEKQLILKACRKYEIIGNILIFHYVHLESIIKLYNKYKNYLKKDKHRMKNKKYKIKYVLHKYKLRNSVLSHILNKYKYKLFIKEVKHFWISIKNIFNNHGKKCGGQKKSIFLKRNNTFKKLIYLSKRKIKRIIFTRETKEFLLKKYVHKYYIVKINLLKIKNEEENKNKIKSIAIYKKVEGKLRRNKIYLVYGENLKTVHSENNIIYKLDLSKCMFSSGNGTEKQRIKNIYLSGNNFLQKENVVDLFCGVGYFTLSLLKFIGDEKINNYYACDINPYSLKLLKDSIKLNKIKKKNLHIIKQNSFSISNNVNMVRKCHRIILGLLPKSYKAWNNAFNLLDNKKGGILHIHGIGKYVFNDDYLSIIRTSNYKDKIKFLNLHFVENLTIPELIQNYENKECNEIGNKIIQTYYNKNKIKNIYLGNHIPINLDFAQFTLLEIFKIALKDYILNKINWVITILNVEKVKSYAPHIYHFVVDIKCTPEFI